MATKLSEQIRAKFREAIQRAASHCHDATQWDQRYWIKEIGYLPIDKLIGSLEAALAEQHEQQLYNLLAIIFRDGGQRAAAYQTLQAAVDAAHDEWAKLIQAAEQHESAHAAELAAANKRLMRASELASNRGIRLEEIREALSEAGIHVCFGEDESEVGQPSIRDGVSQLAAELEEWKNAFLSTGGLWTTCDRCKLGSFARLGDCEGDPGTDSFKHYCGACVAEKLREQVAAKNRVIERLVEMYRAERNSGWGEDTDSPRRREYNAATESALQAAKEGR